MKKSFILHLDSLEILEEMTLEQKGILFDAIHKFQKGEEVNLDFAMKMAFAPFKNQFIRDNEKYNEFKDKQAENGKKGGRPPKPKPNSDNPENPKNPSLLEETQKSPNVSINDSVNENDSENKTVVVTPEQKNEIPEVPEFVRQQQQEFKQEIENSNLLNIEKTKEYLLEDKEVWRLFRSWTNITERVVFEKVLNEFLKIETGSEGLIYPRPKGKSLFHFQSWTKKRLTDSENLLKIEQPKPQIFVRQEETPEQKKIRQEAEERQIAELRKLKEESDRRENENVNTKRTLNDFIPNYLSATNAYAV